jgi:hypothetical protein
MYEARQRLINENAAYADAWEMLQSIQLAPDDED